MLKEAARYLDMDKVYNWVGAAAGVLVGAMGGWDAGMRVLTVCMVLDYITGVLAAIRSRTLSSNVGFWGILRKGTILLMVMLAAQLDIVIGAAQAETLSVCRSAVVLFYIANEAVSVTENAARLGIPVPKKVIEVLQQIKGEERHRDM